MQMTYSLSTFMYKAHLCPESVHEIGILANRPVTHKGKLVLDSHRVMWEYGTAHFKI